MSLREGNWSAKDNKKYRGHLDRIYVSTTEEYELEDFVDDYLKTKNYPRTKDNRERVITCLNDFNGSKPIKRESLVDFLDRRLTL